MAAPCSMLLARGKTHEAHADARARHSSTPGLDLVGEIVGEIVEIVVEIVVEIESRAARLVGSGGGLGVERLHLLGVGSDLG